MPPRIRPAEPADAPTLEIVRRQAIEDGFSAVYDRADFAPLVASPDAGLATWIETDDAIVLVAETDVTVVAYGVYDRKESELLALYTAPDYQGRGYASSLLDRLQGAVDPGGEIAVVAPRNAVSFFESQGFDRIERVDRDGLPCTRLVKSTP